MEALLSNPILIPSLVNTVFLLLGIFISFKIFNHRVNADFSLSLGKDTYIRFSSKEDFLNQYIERTKAIELLNLLSTSQNTIASINRSWERDTMKLVESLAQSVSRILIGIISSNKFKENFGGCGSAFMDEYLEVYLTSILTKKFRMMIRENHLESRGVEYNSRSKFSRNRAKAFTNALIFSLRGKLKFMHCSDDPFYFDSVVVKKIKEEHRKEVSIIYSKIKNLINEVIDSSIHREKEKEATKKRLIEYFHETFGNQNQSLLKILESKLKLL